MGQLKSITVEQYNLFGKKFMDQMKEVNVFESGGRYFLGYPPEVLKAFIRAIPDGKADFYVWLQDNYRELK